MSQTTSREYQNREVFNSWNFMAFAMEYGPVMDIATVTKKDGDTFKCVAFISKDGDKTLVDFTSTTGIMSVEEMVEDRNNLRVIALDYSDDENPTRVRYKLCRSCIKLSNHAVDLSKLQ